MDQAEDRCRQSGFDKLSLIVFEANKVAHDFYLRLGYVEIMRKTIVDHPKIYYTGDALLLVKSL